MSGRTWGGCLEVIEWVLTAGRFPFDAGVLEGGVLIIETSEELLPARNVGWIVRSLGERGVLAAVDAVLVARPPVSDFTHHPSTEERARLRAEQHDIVVELVGRYNPEAVVCVGIPFGQRVRSGSSRTAAQSPSTAPLVRSSPTTHSKADLHPSRTS